MLNKNEAAMWEYFDVLENIKKHIVDSQYKVMTCANIERNILYWNTGNVIVEYSRWGSKFIENLSKDLKMEYPNAKGYTVRNLNYMKQFALRIQEKRNFASSGCKN